MIKNYLSLVKFSHTVFALPFALIGFSLAIQGYPVEVNGSRGLIFIFFTVMICMVSARSAAMAFNRWLDRHLDARNPRTAVREIPAGIISSSGALYFTILMSAIFIATTWFINPLCFALSPIALLVILGYSYTKRFTALCHLVLGLGLSLAPVGAYLAVTGSFAALPIIFSAVVLCWVSGFDIIYALQDEEFDRREGLHSIPAMLGKARALLVSRILHMAAATAIVWAGVMGGFGILYWLGVVVFSGMLVYQQSIVRPDDLSRVNLAFMTANGIASVVFGILAVMDIFIYPPTI